MKKKQKVQIFKLEERVLFDGAAAAEIAAAVDQAAEQNQNQADDHSDNSGQDKEEKMKPHPFPFLLRGKMFYSPTGQMYIPKPKVTYSFMIETSS